MTTISNNNLIPLCLLNILRKHSDENHGLSQQEIIDLIEEEYGKVIDM